MRVIVTGGLGFIGKHLVEALKKQGDEVNILDLFAEEPTDLSSYVETKMFLEEISDHLSKPIDIVYDLATIPLTSSLELPYQTAYKIYCMATVLCELCREGYYKTLVHTSSSEVYGTAKDAPMWENHVMMPQSPYAGAKAAQDMLMISYNRAFQSQICIARPFNTYGEGQDLNAIIPATIKRILAKKQPIIEGSGNQTRDFIYIEDTIRGIMEIARQQEKCYGRIFNLTGSNPIKIKDLVLLICELMKYKGKIKYLPERAGNVDFLLGSGEFVKHILGFEPRVSLIEGLKRTINWWRKQWKNKNFRSSHMPH